MVFYVGYDIWYILVMVGVGSVGKIGVKVEYGIFVLWLYIVLYQYVFVVVGYFYFFSLVVQMFYDGVGVW